MEESFLSWALSLLFLVLISCWTYFLSKKIKVPFTVLLVIIWILLIPISNIWFFSFIDDFKLTPDVLFFVFLPILLFESAYNMNYKHVLKNWKIIWSLAIFWLLISAIVIAIGLYFIFPIIWFEIPFLVCLLFWSLISATDPVAVLSLFKSVWAPRRLTLIFEWESLFNDWTALALFLVVLWIIFEWNIDSSSFFNWFLSFWSMMIGWIIFWWLTWVLFSKTIWLIKNNEAIELSFTMVLAHLTFILSEVIYHKLHIPISWVIATTIAWIVIWNYGRYKITPKVEEYMENFWWFFGFISNSLVFILMWLTLSYIEIDFARFILPIFVVIFVVVFARAISVYIPIWIVNFFKLEEKIPSTWQHLLSWGSLRWALAMMMVLMIPKEWDLNYDKIIKFQEIVGWNYDFSIRDFVMVITVGSIMFTLFLKATTITYLMKKMKIDKLHDLEQFEYEEWKILSYFKIIEKINNSHLKWYMTDLEYENLKKIYELKLDASVLDLKELLNSKKDWSLNLIKKAISLHSLWIEKQYLKELFYYNEIDENNFKYILRKINRQIERVESWDEQLNKVGDITNKDYDIFEKIIIIWWYDYNTPQNIYIRNRVKLVITRKVIRELKKLRDIDFWFDKTLFNDIIDLYMKFNKLAEKVKLELSSKNDSDLISLERKLFNKSLYKLEEKVINDLYQKEIITPKLYIKFMEEIEWNIYEDISIKC